METTKLSSKGQVVLPRSVRAGRKLKPGVIFSVEDVPEGILLRPLKPFAPTTIETAFGCLRYAGKAKTVEDMHRAVLAEARRRR
jgi:AbrB family looped-hinge helix DNA binding protein